MHPTRNSRAADIPSPPFLDAGNDIRTVQELLGHKDMSTTMICTHVLNKGGHCVSQSGRRVLGRFMQTV